MPEETSVGCSLWQDHDLLLSCQGQASFLGLSSTGVGFGFWWKMDNEKNRTEGRFGKFVRSWQDL